MHVECHRCAYLLHFISVFSWLINLGSDCKISRDLHHPNHWKFAFNLISHLWLIEITWCNGITAYFITIQTNMSQILHFYHVIFNVSFFVRCIYLKSRKKEEEQQREEEIYPLVYSSAGFNSCDWARQKTGVWNCIVVSHIGGRNLTPEPSAATFQGIIRELDRKWAAGTWTDTLVRDTGITGCDLICWTTMLAMLSYSMLWLCYSLF